MDVHERKRRTDADGNLVQAHLPEPSFAVTKQAAVEHQVFGNLQLARAEIAENSRQFVDANIGQKAQSAQIYRDDGQLPLSHLVGRRRIEPSPPKTMARLASMPDTSFCPL